MSEVNSVDLLEIVAPIWHVKAETARVVRQRLRTVLEWAVAVEWRSYNPCDRIGPVLGAQGDIVLHMRVLPHAEVAAAVETVRTSESTAPTIKLAFEFLGSGRPVAASTLPKMLQLHGIPDVAIASGRRAGTGRRSGPTIRGRSSKRRWRTSCRTRSRRTMRGRTCSSGGGC